MTKASLFAIISLAVADVAHPVERHLAKVEVASSSLVARSTNEKGAMILLLFPYGDIAKW